MSYSIDINCSVGETANVMSLPSIPHAPYTRKAGSTDSEVNYTDTGSDDTLILRPTVRCNVKASANPYRGVKDIPRIMQDPLALKREVYTRRVEIWKKTGENSLGETIEYVLPQTCSIRLQSTIAKEVTVADLAGFVLRTISPIFPEGSTSYEQLQKLISGFPGLLE